ncbi:hypothetical protein Ahy_B10g102385 [Arachis hypogaea]|uniref:PB1-like domain-containing protein n=1 Tax=Arachis hypogaea TaxID=3818 RepID=A0A444X1V5_ARAHY|nr:hypothetical protein Ahy_B10g102385 [Arachis hypogaea]
MLIIGGGAIAMDNPLITIIFHHGGSFITEHDGSVKYNGGQIFELLGIDIDTLDVIFVRDYHKNIGYDNVTQCWWLVPNRPLQTGLRAVTHDKELMEMCYLAQKSKGVVHVYCEHGVFELVFNEEAELVSSKDKELIMLQDLILHPYPTINVTTKTISTTSLSTPISEPIHTTSPKTIHIPTTSPPTPISEAIHTTIPTPKTIPTTKPTSKFISGPKHMTQPTTISISNSKSPQKRMAAFTATPSTKPTPPQKIMTQPIIAPSTKPNPPQNTMAQSTAAPSTKPNPPPKIMA